MLERKVLILNQSSRNFVLLGKTESKCELAPCVFALMNYSKESKGYGEHGKTF